MGQPGRGSAGRALALRLAVGMAVGMHLAVLEGLCWGGWRGSAGVAGRQGRVGTRAPGE
jgi:hypothetical protein